jgi:hypothetical protein
MFVGLKLLAILGLIGLSFIGLIFLGKYKSKVLKNLLVYSWSAIFIVILLSLVLRPFSTKIVLNKSDYHGSYVIDTSYFDPVQAQWQYDHFRFEMKKNDSIYFYITEKESILKTYKGTIETVQPFESARLKLNMESPTHHIIEDQPTVYRSVWGFTLVFRSPKFSNVYFVKGTYSTDN